MAIFKINSNKKKLPSVSLVSENNALDACDHYDKVAKTTYYLEVGTTFSTSTELFIDAEGTNPAASNWYCNGNEARQWNGSSFINQQNC